MQIDTGRVELKVRDHLVNSITKKGSKVLAVLLLLPCVKATLKLSFGIMDEYKSHGSPRWVKPEILHVS